MVYGSLLCPPYYHSSRLVFVVSFFVYRWFWHAITAITIAVVVVVVCCWMICFGENFRNGCHFIVFALLQLQVYIIIYTTHTYMYASMYVTTCVHMCLQTPHCNTCVRTCGMYVFTTMVYKNYHHHHHHHHHRQQQQKQEQHHHQNPSILMDSHKLQSICWYFLRFGTTPRDQACVPIILHVHNTYNSFTRGKQHWLCCSTLECFGCEKMSPPPPTTAATITRHIGHYYSIIHYKFVYQPRI